MCTPGINCWNGTSGGYLPNWSGNTAYWGYGGGILRWTTAINAALKEAGIQVNGYNYVWRVKNADTNFSAVQNDGDDYMRISVSLYDDSGNNVYYKQFNLDGTYDWSTFQGTEWFANPLVGESLSHIQIRAEGDDIGYWAGYYGPEFDVASSSVNLLYTVTQQDPCAATPVVDPTCPGFVANFPEPIQPDPNFGAPPEVVVAASTATEVVITVAETTPTIETVEQPSAPVEVAQQETTSQQEPEQQAQQEVAQQQETQTAQQSEQQSQQSESQQSSNAAAISFVINKLLTENATSATTTASTTTSASDPTSATSVTSVVPGGASVTRKFDPVSQQLDGLIMASPTESAEQPRGNSSESSSGDSKQNDTSSGNTEVAAVPEGQEDTASQMAEVPQSFSNYTTTMSDVSFYPSVDIYANMKVPEKARNLRMGLASQILWDKMVDMQYNNN